MIKVKCDRGKPETGRKKCPGSALFFVIRRKGNLTTKPKRATEKSSKKQKKREKA
jgi:hypothetical protein